MMPVDAIWRLKMRPALLTAVLLLAGLDCSAAVAQNIMRSPNLNISSRIPRIDPNLAGRALPGIAVDNLRIRSPCEAADRDSGNCSGSVAGNTTNRKNRNKTASTSSGASLGVRVISNEIVAEIDGTLSEAQVDALARRHGLRRIDSRNFELLGSTIGLFRIVGGKTPEAAGRNFAQDGSVRSVQPNLHYTLQDQHAGEGDPAQYPQAKLHLAEAHALSEGVNVTVAVIDSGIDLKHGEFTGVTITPFDALESKEGPHAHGTGVAGAIVSHVRVMGSAPAAHILAIRAFGTSGKGAESTSYTLLKAFDLAASHGAQIVNMSFAGPKDGLVGRCLSALAARHVVMVAAAGNAGPKSPPLYPAADANVIAVGATDAHDRLFFASNRGSYIAVSAPGVDIFLPAPDNKYQITSGTSFSSAFVSGLAALMLQRNPALKADEVRAILMKTARDLGPPGPDDQFGAGEADAFAAVSAVPVASLPVATASERPTPAGISGVPNTEPAETRDISATTMAADKAAGDEATPNPNQTKSGTR
jgi:subtilisin family serine protease